RVAMLGGGPAGRAAAAQLIRGADADTGYEWDENPGGLRRYGIPDFKWQKWVIDRRIKLLEEEGVLFRCNAEVGGNVPVTELQAYDAVVLAGGSTIPRNLDIPGRELDGVHFAMELLKQQNKRVGNSPFTEKDIIATGKNVLVI